MRSEPGDSGRGRRVHGHGHRHHQRRRAHLERLRPRAHILCNAHQHRLARSSSARRTSVKHEARRGSRRRGRGRERHGGQRDNEILALHAWGLHGAVLRTQPRARTLCALERNVRVLLAEPGVLDVGLERARSGNGPGNVRLRGGAPRTDGGELAHALLALPRGPGKVPLAHVEVRAPRPEGVAVAVGHPGAAGQRRQRARNAMRTGRGASSPWRCCGTARARRGALASNQTPRRTACRRAAVRARDGVRAAARRPCSSPRVAVRARLATWSEELGSRRAGACRGGSATRAARPRPPRSAHPPQWCPSWPGGTGQGAAARGAAACTAAARGCRAPAASPTAVWWY
ncbi:hypothetical protein FA95DRAFT_615559 [Auriscalpium vulgare]|uniref:Uncharacterized protein n=1 Tax=Auriscalpium vulgare TaxID=40419 RepID=A0ACB8RDY5_9AGAM|nr:hypothetical protein FA95DRAFT_615559 [Auriscalpium vulgare]